MNAVDKRYEELASGLDDMREVARAMVAGLVADGFSEEQARWLVVGIMTTHLRKDSTEEES
jgi:hypothetical protein